VVKTDNGDFVLDKLSSAVRPLARSGYRIIEEMSADPDVWT
jgi:predicted transglutaminase-like cysteine proteinase